MTTDGDGEFPPPEQSITSTPSCLYREASLTVCSMSHPPST